jgi:hypothetical protein
MNKLCIAALILYSNLLFVNLSQAEPSEIFEYEGISFKLLDSNCFKADFDGNGVNDYVAPMGEGWTYVFMNLGADSEKIFEIYGGGVAELYAPRKNVGERDEPIADNPSILIRWVGQNHIVFIWEGIQKNFISWVL